MQFYNPEKLKSYLRMESSRLGIGIQNTYNTFFARLLLERLMKVSGNKLFVCGSFSQLIHLGTMIRPATDVDLFSKVLNQEMVLDLFKLAFKSSIEDLSFELKDNYSVSSTGMLSIKCNAHFGSINFTIDVDVNINHPIFYEEHYKRVPKIFTADSEYFAFVPSSEDHLAQKLCIVVEDGVRTGKTNSRVKDLYDIYKMHGGSYDLQKFSLYFQRMIADRGKINLVDLNTDFLDAAYIEKNQAYWNNLSQKYDFMDKEITLAGTVFYTRAVLSEQLKRIRDGENEQKGMMLALINPNADKND